MSAVEIVEEVVALLMLFVPCCHTLLQSGLGSADEVRLVEQLFQGQGYNPLIRPVHNLSDKVTVKFGLAMIQLINVDEKNQIMKSNVWLRMLWYDNQLLWDPGEFGGINVIRVIPAKVWKPDIVLFNNADGRYEVSYKPNVVLYYTGDVLWIPPAIYKSSCTIDVKYFPFDQQQCEMKFGSWTFNGDQVLLDWYEGLEKVDLSDYVNSGTWDIVACPGRSHYVYDQHKQQHYAWIIFTLHIRRKTLFYTVNLIIPCILISFLSVCTFYLPVDAGEKMTMCVSILLALIVFLLLVSKILPPTSLTVPLIAKYLLFTFVMNIFAIVLAVFIINWSFKTPKTHRMPRWARLVFIKYLSKLLLMQRPEQHGRKHAKYCSSPRCSLNAPDDPERKQPEMDSADEKLMKTVTSDVTSDVTKDEENWFTKSDRWDAASPVPVLNLQHSPGGVRIGKEADQRSPPTTGQTEEAIDAVRFIANHLSGEDEYAEILDDWRYTAMVIDRLQLYIFLLVTLSGTIALLINTPHIFEFVDQEEIKHKIISSTDGIV